MAHLERLRVFPVKGLDGMDVEASQILEGGTLRYDREFALFDEDGAIVNGRQTARIHELATEFDPGTAVVRIDPPAGGARQFTLETDLDDASQWFSEYLGMDVTLRRDSALGFVDRREMGPSVVSTATLETVASWFQGLTVEGARRRLRANVEIGGVPAFWEDRFLGEEAPSFAVQGIRFEGVTPCGRCVVPQRDPDTGEPLPEFRDRFVRRREATFPEWADETAFDHLYAVMIITRIPEADRGRTLRVGTEVTILE